ncbi:Fe(3+) dicitrate ABC transporter permease subunit FecD [Vibrio fluvialis]|uniref:Fe(3+) dicitrate ABC transporter permease subunit FecD n=1 Tax=Vibrio fluvialis TaxID=676 RepID=UPI001EEAFB45|nr:Fe(3+) dicitrate ABC transporter permease subunit FecD [Vibrio fluvialis]ELS8948473.1 Fe(3+) dicitrate ABC transporter permease subunit FecD [Vibrio fluvialis]MCG6386086.1 Fe(3+) dicitrate ABC transporter permease subunit FecD [Vibrio fluvialis]
MNPIRKTQLILLCLLVVAALANLSLGAVNLSTAQVWDGLFQGSEHYFTIHDYRLPRVWIALLVGAMLATAGVLIQGVIRNPLASPDILGVSHGAGLAAVALMTLWPTLSVYWLPAAALAGGLASAVVLALVCGGQTAPVKLAITGVALAALYGSAIDFLILTQPLEINNALLWLTGSLWGRGWSQLTLLWPWWVLLPVVLWLSHALNLLTLGDERATSLGISVAWVRAGALLVAVIWTSAAVAVCGPLSFLGLVAPHLARQLVGGRHQQLLPTAMLVGALLLLVADLIARIIHPPLELPSGILTAIIGAPYFLYLLMRMR